MFARFTVEARQACNYAGLEAATLSSSTIGTEHLLLGLLVSDTAACSVLGAAGVDLQQIRSLLSAGDSQSSTAAASYSDNALTAIRAADQRAGSDLIDLRHLWAGVLGVASGGAVRVLELAGLDRSLLKGSGPEAHPGLAPSSPARSPSPLIDLCALAEEGKLAPVVGREAEMHQLMETLLRWHKSTPVLVGDPGVGKTAVVEGLAWRLASDQVPDPLKGSRIVSLDIGSLVAGTRYRGDLEERVRRLLAGLVEDRSQILFIDELHMVLGAGGSEGQMNVGGLLKPMLARGQIRMIAATTAGDYQRYLTRDPAFERRLQPITVDEPNEQDIRLMLKAVAGRLEKHHHLKIEDDALEMSLRLSIRFMPDRRLPDKAVDVLDQAAAACALVGTSKVDGQAVAGVMERWTGVASGHIKVNQRTELAGLERRLSARLIDQPEATALVARTLQRSRVGLAQPGRPLGSFLFCGPTGVGKTEMARILTNEIFGPPGRMLRFDMSEYSESHTISRLLGTAPGYVGYQEGGQLINALRKTPHAVLVFDEIEKAHSAIINLLLQALEEGQLHDGRGQSADLSNVILIMTSNLGSRWSSHSSPSMGFSAEPLGAARQRRMDEELQSFFAPELLGRVDEVVFFNSLSEQGMEKVATLLLEDLKDRLAIQEIKFHFSPGVAGWIVEQKGDQKLGARPLRSVIRNLLEDRLAQLIIDGELQPGGSVYSGVRSGQLTIRVSKKHLD